MTNKKKENKIENGDLERLFPFLILLLIGFVRFMISKKKKEEPNKPVRPVEQPGSSSVEKKSISQLPVASPLIVEKLPERFDTNLKLKRDEHYWRKGKKTRVQRLVENAGGGQKVILLSEILKKHDFLQF